MCMTQSFNHPITRPVTQVNQAITQTKSVIYSNRQSNKSVAQYKHPITLWIRQSFDNERGSTTKATILYDSNCESVNQSVSQSANHLVGDSSSQTGASETSSINQPITVWNNHSVWQPVIYTVYQPVNQLLNQAVSLENNHFMNQPVNYP